MRIFMKLAMLSDVETTTSFSLQRQLFAGKNLLDISDELAIRYFNIYLAGKSEQESKTRRCEKLSGSIR